MNQQQHSEGGLTPFSSEPLVKRRRGRPRKEDTLAQATAKLTPIKPPQALSQTNGSSICTPPPFQPQADLTEGKDAAEDANPKDDEMIGQVVTGVLEGMFDAGYFLTVKVGESDTRLRGLVFQPGKFVPVTTENDIAPAEKMCSRIDEAYDLIISSSKPVESGGGVNSVRLVEPIGFDLESTLEKSDGGMEEKVDLEAEKENDPILVENSSLVPEEGPILENGMNGDEEPSEAAMESKDAVKESANGDEENVVVDEKEIEAVEEKGVVSGYMNECFGSPRLELALSSSAFEVLPVDHAKPGMEKNLQPDEGQQKIPPPNLDPIASSGMKDVLKISIDVDQEGKSHVEDITPPVVVPSFQLFEEIGSGREDEVLESLAKKPKIDEAMHFGEVASSEGGIQTEDMKVVKEVVEGQGFISLACLNKPMETD